MNKLSWILILLLILSCKKHQNTNSDVLDSAVNSDAFFYTDSTGLDFINHSLKKEIYSNDPVCKYLVSHINRFYIDDPDRLFSKISPFFSADEIDSLKEKFEKERSYSYRQADIQNYELIDLPENLTEDDFFNNSDKWNDFLKNHDCFLIIEHPVINKEKTVLIVRTVDYCGMECGKENLLLYNKDENGKWIFVRNLEGIQA